MVNEELEVPHWKPQFLVSPVAPEKEPDRVAPVALTFVVEPVVTVAVAVAVWPPEVPPPDGSQLYSTTMLFIRICTLAVPVLVIVTELEDPVHVPTEFVQL